MRPRSSADRARNSFCEFVGFALDGAHVDISLTISPVKDANEVIVGASKIARDITEGGHSLTVDLAPEPLIVEADPVRRAQVLSNLLNNTAKFTKSGGEIRIDLEPQDAHAELKTRDMGLRLFLMDRAL